MGVRGYTEGVIYHDHFVGCGAAYFAADGGDLELIDVTDDGKVTVRLTGACGSCPMSQMTLKMGVEQRLREEVPEVVSVDAQ